MFTVDNLDKRDGISRSPKGGVELLRQATRSPELPDAASCDKNAGDTVVVDGVRGQLKDTHAANQYNIAVIFDDKDSLKFAEVLTFDA